VKMKACYSRYFPTPRQLGVSDISLIPLVAIVGWPKGFGDGLRPATPKIEMISTHFSPALSCIVLHSFNPIYL